MFFSYENSLNQVQNFEGCEVNTSDSNQSELLADSGAEEKYFNQVSEDCMNEREPFMARPSIYPVPSMALASTYESFEDMDFEKKSENSDDFPAALSCRCQSVSPPPKKNPRFSWVNFFCCFSQKNSDFSEDEISRPKLGRD